MELLKNLEGLSADEQMSAVVELQKAAMKHLEEQKQASIGKSAEMVIQGLKKIKSDFEAKFDSLNYDIQTKVANLKDGEQGLQGPKGEQGDRGLDGSNGRDGRDGKDGKDGTDGVDGVGVRDAKIDFDGSLVISLTDGREINCGEVVSVDVAKQIQKVTHNIQTGSGGDSQTVLDAIAALQATIATYGTMATQNANNVAITGGTIDNTTIGATTPSTGVFTSVTTPTVRTTGASQSFTNTTGEALRITDGASATAGYLNISNEIASATRTYANGAATNVGITWVSKGTGAHNFASAGAAGTLQMAVSHTASAVNYVQVTGAATSGTPTISAQGSDTNPGLNIQGKGFGAINFLGGTGGILFQISGTNAGSRNYLRAESSATTFTPILSAQGSDTNISQVFQSKGTGAIDLAAGSSGVNISNGGTVTAITRVSGGSGYTSIPSAVISAPTTAGGTQATLSPGMAGATATVVAGGSGYTVGDTLTIVGSTGTASQLTVATLSGSAVATVTFAVSGNMTALPTNPVSVTGGTGSGATFTMTYALAATQSSFTAGSGYVEQPTVTFSGGGGSGAAAYATVGGDTAVKTLGTNLTFSTPAGPVLALADSTTGGAYIQLSNSSTGNTFGRATGSATNIGFYWLSKGTGGHAFTTNNNSGTVQFNVSHTASAVNYVQVTGSPTGSAPTISAQGSDSNIPLTFIAKGSNGIVFQTRGTGTPRVALQLIDSGSASVNFMQIQSNIAGAAPNVSCLGTDTNIDLALTPKGTGNVRFGTYTGTISAITGYIEIKDAGGTIRRLAVVA